MILKLFRLDFVFQLKDELRGARIHLQKLHGRPIDWVKDESRSKRAVAIPYGSSPHKDIPWSDDDADEVKRRDIRF